VDGVSDQPEGPGWWQGSDGKSYPPYPAFALHGGLTDTKSVRWRNGCLIALGVVVGIAALSIGLGLVFAPEFDTTRKDNDPTISSAEFDQIENGMTLSQVEAIVGGRGALISWAGEGANRTELYRWDGGSLTSLNGNVTFHGGEVVAKEVHFGGG
jgi:hypothetical protein